MKSSTHKKQELPAVNGPFFMQQSVHLKFSGAFIHRRWTFLRWTTMESAMEFWWTSVKTYETCHILVMAWNHLQGMRGWCTIFCICSLVLLPPDDSATSSMAPPVPIQFYIHCSSLFHGQQVWCCMIQEILWIPVLPGTLKEENPSSP